MGYLEIISKLFGGIPELLSGIKQVKELKKGQKGIKNMLVAELELNLSLLLDDYLKGGVDELKIIDHLQVACIQKALDANYGFTELTKNKLQAKDIPKDAYLEKLEGFTVEKLFRKAFIKINELKRIQTLYTAVNPEKLRLNVRLKNLLKLLLITARLIGSESSFT